MAMITAGKKKERDRFNVSILNCYLKSVDNYFKSLNTINRADVEFSRMVLNDFLIGQQFLLPLSLRELRQRIQTGIHIFECRRDAMNSDFPEEIFKEFSFIPIVEAAAKAGLKAAEELQADLFPADMAVPAPRKNYAGATGECELTIYAINQFTHSIHDHCRELAESGHPVVTADGVETIFADALTKGASLPLRFSELHEKIMTAIEQLEDAYLPDAPLERLNSAKTSIRGIAEQGLGKVEEYQRIASDGRA